MTSRALEETLTRVHHEEWARVVATLARQFGDLNAAEEAAADAFSAAVERWPTEGVPPNPGGWLTVTATRKAIDRLRRESQRDTKHQAARMLYADSQPEWTGPVEDDRLRLIFICAHPALGMQARVALTLRMIGGLTVPEISRAFLVQERAMAQRITRAKAKIKAAHIPYRVPSSADIGDRLSGVLAVVYLVFNEGYLATEGENAVRVDLTDEAIRLGRLLRDLLPEEGEVAGLLALMLLTDARRAARVSDSGELVTLEDQDRAAWDRELIAEGHGLVRERLVAVAAGAGRPGRYQLLAAINAVHTDAPSARDTDWSQVVTLYDQLVAVDPSPVVRLNRAVAVAELDGPAVGLAEVDRLADTLDSYHAFHVARAELLRRVERSAEAHAAYDRAIALAGNPAEVAHLTRRRAQLARGDAEASSQTTIYCGTSDDMGMRLRILEDADLDQLFEWEQDPAAVGMAAFTRVDRSNRAAFDGHYQRIRNDPDATLLAIDDGAFAGTIASFTMEGEREVSYWIDPSRWGRGIASRALNAFVQLETTRPLFARVAAHNLASARVLTRAGFEQVGSEISYADGVGHDVVEHIYSLTE